MPSPGFILCVWNIVKWYIIFYIFTEIWYIFDFYFIVFFLLQKWCDNRVKRYGIFNIVENDIECRTKSGFSRLQLNAYDL